MIQLYVLSRCLLVHENEAVFHFRGSYLGKKVIKIKIINSKEQFFKGRDYLLDLKFTKIVAQVLFVELIRFKELSC